MGKTSVRSRAGRHGAPASPTPGRATCASWRTSIERAVALETTAAILPERLPDSVSALAVGRQAAPPARRGLQPGRAPQWHRGAACCGGRSRAGGGRPGGGGAPPGRHPPFPAVPDRKARGGPRLTNIVAPPKIVRAASRHPLQIPWNQILDGSSGSVAPQLLQGPGASVAMMDDKEKQ